MTQPEPARDDPLASAGSERRLPSILCIPPDYSSYTVTCPVSQSLALSGAAVGYLATRELADPEPTHPRAHRADHRTGRGGLPVQAPAVPEMTLPTGKKYPSEERGKEPE
jgi:hypothetical protein